MGFPQEDSKARRTVEIIQGRKVMTDFLGEADIKDMMSDGYNAYTLFDSELEKIAHLICMVHAKVKFGRACEHGEDAVAKELRI